MPAISVIIPAHNEQDHLPLCIASIEKAAATVSHSVEIIVSLNRCNDRTEDIAKKAGATIAREDAKNLSLIRNAGAALATGDILITIDADSRMAPGTLREVTQKLATSRYIGGGSLIRPERYSLGILATAIVVSPYLLRHGVSFGMFWCHRVDFQAIGGFNPDFVTIEDIDFANRLRALGKERKQRFGTVWKHPITTSCRKFDLFGDWHLVKDPAFLRRVFTGKDQSTGDAYWYNARD